MRNLLKSKSEVAVPFINGKRDISILLCEGKIYSDIIRYVKKHSEVHYASSGESSST